MMKQFMAGSCYSYILSSGREALVIDPHLSLFNAYSDYLKSHQLELKWIVDTHTHADHFSLAAVLRKNGGAKILMHEKAVSSIADKRFQDNDQIPLGDGNLKVLYSPGHTDDAVTLSWEKKIFTGDVLLIGSVGRTDFQNGSPESMFDTLQRLKELPDETMVYPGHDYHGVRSSTIGKEKRNNPFLKESDKAAFVRNMRSKVIPKPFNIDNIVRVNQKGEAVALEMTAPKDVQRGIEKKENVLLLDVRSPLEFDAAHIPGAVNIPLDGFAAKVSALAEENQQRGFVVVCRTGNRASMAADMLIQSGLQGVKVLSGGMDRWTKEGLPAVKGKQSISLERQVRVIAGGLVLAGILLSWFVHGALIGLSIFVGCGLVFAGLTDSCLMGMMLMKLPYNKKMYQAKTGGGTCAMG